MWLEAILSVEDLRALVHQLTPLTIHFANDDFLELTDPADIVLVPETGLRIVCKARLLWTVLGIGVPIKLHSLQVLLCPEILKQPAGDVLVFKVIIEHADVSGVPTVFDNRVTESVNNALIEKRVELVWNFTDKLTHRFKLPQALSPVDTLGLEVCAGKLKITRDALVLAVAFRASVTRAEAKSGSASPASGADGS